MEISSQEHDYLKAWSQSDVFCQILVAIISNWIDQECAAWVFLDMIDRYS